MNKPKAPVTIAVLAALLVMSFFLDNIAATAITRLRTPGLTAAMVLLTKYFVWVYIAFLAATMAFAAMKARKDAAKSNIALIASVATTLAVAYLLKFALHRHRPDGVSLKIFSGAEDYSFPSSHVATSSAAMFSSPAGMRALWIPFMVLVLFSRLYLNVHFLSDTIGGMLIAAMVSFFIKSKIKTAITGDDRRELRRQFLHALIGLAIAAFVWAYSGQWRVILSIAAIGLAASYAIKKTAAARNRAIKRLRNTAVAALGLVERTEGLQKFPGKGAITLFLGCGITVAIFRQEAAAAIAILAVGDSVSHLAGRLLGSVRHRWMFASEKMVEGTLFGIAFASAAAATIMPVRVAIAAASAAMLVEAANIRLFGKKVDDNLTVPLAAAAVIWAARLF